MIDKSLFVETIEALRIQNSKDKKTGDIVAEAFGFHEHSVLYDTSDLSNIILKLLQQDFPIKGECCEISEYCYLMNFGKPFPDSEYESPEQLYERLIKSK